MRALMVLTVAAGLALFTPAATQHAAHAATLRPQAHTRVLYHSTFSRATFRAWSSTLRRNGWTLAGNNTATYNGNSATVLTAPLSIRGLKNFAVQAVIKAPDSTGSNPVGLPSFGLDIGLGGSYGSAVRVGTQFSTNPDQNAPQMWWGDDSVSGYPDNSIILPAKDSGQSARYAAYRLEVRGTDYTFLIDNKVVIHFNLGPHKLGPQVGIFSIYSRMTIKSFSVIRLPAGGAQPLLPAVKNLVLNGADLLDLSLDQGHFYSNEEVARFNKTTPAAIAATGRLLGYEADYSAPNSSPIGFVASGDTAWASADQANADADGAARYYSQTFGEDPNYTQTPVPELGSHASLVVYDYKTSDGYTYRDGIIVFSRGTYSAYIFASGSIASEPVQSMESQLIAWAKIVDARVPAAR
jgi:hypothetical protein